MCFGWLIMALDCHANLCRCPKWQIIEGCACANSKPFAPICRASLVPPSPGQSAVLPSWPQSPPSAVALLHVYHPLPTSPRHPATQTCKSATPLLLTTNTTASRPSARRSGGVGGEKRRRAKLPARPPPRAHAPTHKHLEVPSGLHWANSVLRLICTARPVGSGPSGWWRARRRGPGWPSSALPPCWPALELFDAVTYTTCFVLAFLGTRQEHRQEPCGQSQGSARWPSRVAGAATLAPVINKGLKSIQGKLNLPSQMYAFALVVGSVASVCFTVVGIFILSTSGESKGNTWRMRCG
ncbi:uncharacterized protein LOC110436340 isoform X2 [Sorghum bicolor]|uniref:uncharacterized protein LOC110436340 isoform X2 n=1 Tax=Sorghum bicolor TaxID=4558 RepID=UPI000B425A99|nr:uncharacterized protein LOC110436340 isoform X2 [Sorghum bicolor]|eukprot:XP_021318848.1 uncharacterized protein LOC110436340 isoform X2 [Sorghum bicolor]